MSRAVTLLCVAWTYQVLWTPVSTATLPLAHLGSGLPPPVLCTDISLTATAIHSPGRGRDGQYLAHCRYRCPLNAASRRAPLHLGLQLSPSQGKHSTGLVAAYGLFQAPKFRSKLMLPPLLVESLRVGSHQTAGGGQHGGVWGLRPLSWVGDNSANRSQAAGVCVGTRVAGKYLHGSKPGGASRHRERPASVSKGKTAEIG